MTIAPTEQTLSQELADIEADTGWVLWISEQGNVWMASVSGITLRAPTPKEARREIAEWEHEADLRCQLPAAATCERPGCTHDSPSHWDGTGSCGFCGCGGWVTAA